MCFDVPGNGSSAALAALIGSTEDETIGTATIADRVRLFARNLLLHDGGLCPPPASGMPNPSSHHPSSTAEDLRSDGRSLETMGCFIFSSVTTSGYEMAGAAGNYNFRIVQTATVNIDIRTAGGPFTSVDSGNTAVYQDPYLVAGRLQALIRASALADAANFTVTYSGWRETTPTYKFTIACPTSFTLTVTADASSGWPSLGVTTTRTSVASAVGDQAVIHTEEYLVLALASPRLSFDRDRAYINRWRHLILDTNFNPASQTNPFPRLSYGLVVRDPFGTLADIDFTGQQFTTKEALAEWLNDALEALFPGFSGAPWSSFINGSGALVFQSLGPEGLDVIITGDANTVGPLIGFPVDTNNVLIHTTGIAFDLDALNAALNQLAPGGTDKIVVYVGGTAAVLDQAPDSDFTDGDDMFPIRDDAQMGVSWGTDAAGWPRVGTPAASGHDLFPARRLWIDLYEWSGTAPNQTYVRIKIVNRQNPAGFLALAAPFAGPAMWLTWNVLAGSDDTLIDRSSLDYSPAGAPFATARDPGARVALETDALTRDEALILRGTLLDARAIDETQAHALAPGRHLVGSKTRPVYVIDESNRSDLLDSVGKAYGMVRGRIESFSLKPSARLGQGYVEATLVVAGDR